MARLTFLDTSFIFASLYPGDSNHEAAVELRSRLRDARLVTTNHVRGESWTLFRRKRGHPAAVLGMDLIERSPRIEVAHLAPALETEALAWLRRHDEREYSFVDATSFAFMRANQITEALAFDDGFAAAGFVELRP